MALEHRYLSYKDTHTHTHTHRWLLASADDTAVPFFVSCGFSRKISIPKKIYSKVLTTYEVPP